VPRLWRPSSLGHGAYGAGISAVCSGEEVAAGVAVLHSCAIARRRSSSGDLAMICSLQRQLMACGWLGGRVLDLVMVCEVFRPAAVWDSPPIQDLIQYDSAGATHDVFGGDVKSCLPAVVMHGVS
jgi:hypothetical protein